jgi:hypothetical protein
VGKYYAYLFGKVFNRQVYIFIGANSIVNYMLFALNIRLKAFNAFPNKGGVFRQNKTASTATQARKEQLFNQAVQPIIGRSHCCAKFGQQTRPRYSYDII